MSDFQTMKIVAARKARYCPECGQTIAVGQRYAKVTGSWEGDFYAAAMCMPCKVFTDRYFESMHSTSSLNWDECTVTYGDVINEAAEYAGFERMPHQPRHETRDAIMALFGEIDLAEREWRARERKERRRAKVAAERQHLNWVASLRLVRGMSACSAHLAPAA